MNILYAPWRSPYSDSRNTASVSHNPCVFCVENEEIMDEDNFILKRAAHCYVVLNKYPYNAGHLMVIPYAHVKSLEELTAAARHEIIDVATMCTKILAQMLNCQGINIGLNLGQASGAGIPDHLHTHILPRWQGDTNFLPTLAHTKVISFDLTQMYQKLKPAFI
jgi:ATP adenylyltransferase